jgi:transposase InsO family protein
MKLHGNAALSWSGRRRLAERVVGEGWTLAAAAAAAGVSVRCAQVGRALPPRRGARPLRSLLGTTASRQPHARRARRCHPRPQMAAHDGGRDRRDAHDAALDRLGRAHACGARPPRPDRPRATLRYERSRPGELVHVDVKQLGRIEGGAGKRVTAGIKRNPDRRRVDAAGIERKTIGWEYVHVAIDDHSRLAYAEVLPDQKATTAIGFLRRAVAFYRRYGIEVERLLTDNGSAYVSALHALACRRLGIRHLRTRPFRPQTNGKAERFIRTLASGWAYGAVYASSAERTAALDGWLWHYNHRRRHSALGRQPPVSRTNVLGSYT